MVRNILIILFISLVLFMSACDNSGVVPADDGPFKGGAEGVEISFMPAAPSTSFDQDQSEPVRIKLKNNGEYDIPSGEAMVKIFGIHHASFGLSSEFKGTTGPLRGVSEFIDEGGEQIIEMGNLKYTPDITNFYEFSLKAKACYPYETNSQVMACISSSSIEESGGDLECGIDGNKIKSGTVSRSPIQIDSFTEELRGADQIIFNMGISNDGNGDVYDPEVTCSDLDDAIKKGEAENIIYVEVDPMELICSFLGDEGNNGKIRLKQTGDNTLTCRMFVEEGESNYEQRIRVRLKYKYVDSVSKDLTVYEVKS